MLNFFDPQPNLSQAYYTDGTDKWYGKASKGSTTASARWVIVKIEHSGDNWVTKYPDGSDQPKFVWDAVASLTYKMLGT